ncbi:MAG TPA: aldo/keto reductase [Firmicutes bacterium]|nr:aldo/keto reductase [Bacillota bacterium]
MKKLGFGLMRLPVKSAEPTDINQEELNKMVDLFLERGFTYFDTSYVYHNGASETAIRDALVKRHSRDSFVLASKFPTFLMPKEDQADKILDEQLEKCGVEYFDFYLLHNLNRYLYKTEVADARLFEHMKKWKEEGKIRHIAFSYHDDAEHLDQILAEHPEVEAVQIALNYYDWDEPFIQAGKCYEVIRKHGVKVIVMEPVKGGALANVPAEIKAQMEQNDKNASPASYAIRFAASLEGVMVVLSGMSDLAQVGDNTSFMSDMKPMTDKERELLKSAKDALRGTWKYNCSDFDALDDNAYGVPISGIIRAYNSLLIQPNPYFGAELNYYKSFRTAYYRAFESGDFTAQTKSIGGAFDVNEALKEAIEFQIKNSFQTYID